MGTIKIAVDGKPIFEWSGNEDAIKYVLEEFPEAARFAGFTPEVFASNCVLHLIKSGFPKDDDEARGMLMGIIWEVLQKDTDDPDHPGKYGDYAATAIAFNFDFVMEGDFRVACRMTATPKFDS
jgi:hypothetical protein